MTIREVQLWATLRRVAVNPVPSQGVWRCLACYERPGYGTWYAQPGALNVVENHAPDCLARIETDAIAINFDDEDPGTCLGCGEPWQIVRPGKSQPNCRCESVITPVLSPSNPEEKGNA